MVETTTPTPPAPRQTAGSGPSNFRDQIIREATSLPQLLAAAKVADPMLFDAIVGSHNKSIWLAPLASAVGWGVAKFGLGWDSDTCTAVAGALLTALTAAWHYFTPSHQIMSNPKGD